MQDAEMMKKIDGAIKGFSGNSKELEMAIGMLICGRQMGWKVMYLIHSQRTIWKYENILGLTIREVLPEEGALSKKSLAWAAVQKVSNYWKAVKGDTPGIRTPELK